MLSTPNPTAFNFTDPALVKWPKGRSGAEFSGSVADHVASDPLLLRLMAPKAASIPVVPYAIITIIPSLSPAHRLPPSTIHFLKGCGHRRIILVRLLGEQAQPHWPVLN